MLKISRKEGESFIIGDDIKVTIQRTKKASVIIGVNAPEDVCILREEVYFGDLDNGESNLIKHESFSE